jgi:hypothetical protein
MLIISVLRYFFLAFEKTISSNVALIINGLRSLVLCVYFLQQCKIYFFKSSFFGSAGGLVPVFVTEKTIFSKRSWCWAKKKTRIFVPGPHFVWYFFPVLVQFAL